MPHTTPVSSSQRHEHFADRLRRHMQGMMHGRRRHQRAEADTFSALR